MIFPCATQAQTAALAQEEKCHCQAGKNDTLRAVDLNFKFAAAAQFGPRPVEVLSSRVGPALAASIVRRQGVRPSRRRSIADPGFGGGGDGRRRRGAQRDAACCMRGEAPRSSLARSPPVRFARMRALARARGCPPRAAGRGPAGAVRAVRHSVPCVRCPPLCGPCRRVPVTRAHKDARSHPSRPGDPIAFDFASATGIGPSPRVFSAARAILMPARRRRGRDWGRAESRPPPPQAGSTPCKRRTESSTRPEGRPGELGLVVGGWAQGQCKGMHQSK